MSAKRISAAERADRGWEAAQERAAEWLKKDNILRAARWWEVALAIAEKHFAADDPRLATSLANAAAVRRSSAAAMLARARAIWAQSPMRIAQIRPTRRARSSLHHLRLERRHRDAYRRLAQARLLRLAAQARRRLDEIAAGDKPLASRLSEWRIEKPPRIGDERKMLAACLLLV